MRLAVCSLLLVLPGCLTRMLWEPDTPGHSAEPNVIPLNVERFFLATSPEGEILDGAIEFQAPLGTRIPRYLRKQLLEGRGSFGLARKAAGDFHFPVKLYASDRPLRSQDIEIDRKLRLRLVVTNAEARNSFSASNAWEGRLELRRNGTLLQSIEYAVRFLPQFPRELPPDAGPWQDRVSLEYGEYKTIPRYTTGRLALRVLATPLTVIGDVVGVILVEWICCLLRDDEDC